MNKCLQMNAFSRPCMAVWTVIADAGVQGIRTGEVAEGLGRCNRYVRAAVVSLRAAGLVARIGKVGVLVLPEFEHDPRAILASVTEMSRVAKLAHGGACSKAASVMRIILDSPMGISYDDIAEKLGLELSHARRAVRRLQRRGVVKVYRPAWKGCGHASTSERYDEMVARLLVEEQISIRDSAQIARDKKQIASRARYAPAGGATGAAEREKRRVAALVELRGFRDDGIDCWPVVRRSVSASVAPRISTNAVRSVFDLARAAA